MSSFWWHQDRGSWWLISLSPSGSIALDKWYWESTEAARAVGVLSSVSRSSCYGPGQAAVVAGSMHTGSFGGSLLAPAVAGGNCKHTWSGGDQGRQQGPGPTVYTWLVGALPWLLGLTTSMWQWGPPGIGLRAHRYTFGGVRCRWVPWCRPVTEDRAWSRPSSSCMVPGYWHALPWLHSLPMDIHIIVKSGDRRQACGMQVHS